MFCYYCCANFAGGGLPNRAAVAANCCANLDMSSRRRNFCFLNLLNLALSPFCDDICPRSSSLFVTQRAKDKAVRSSIHQVADGGCEAQSTLRGSPLQRLRVRLLGLLPGCRQNILRHARSILHFSKDPPMSLRTRKTRLNAAAATRFPKNGAVSTGRCNTGLEFTGRSFKSQGFRGC